MNFGPTHFVQTSATLKREPRKTIITSPTRSGLQDPSLYAGASPTAVLSPKLKAKHAVHVAFDCVLSQTESEYRQKADRIFQLCETILNYGDIPLNNSAQLSNFVVEFDWLTENQAGSFALLKGVIQELLSFEKGSMVPEGTRERLLQQLCLARSALDQEKGRVRII